MIPKMKSDSTSTPIEGLIDEITRACLLTRTHRISRVLTNMYDQWLRVHGINSHQFTLLVTIHRLGAATRAEIGRANQQDRSTITRNLQLVIAEGWVEEVEGATRGRCRPVTLTRVGKKLLKEAAPAWHEAQAAAVAALGKTGADAMLQMADQLLDQSDGDWM
jgi:DNA-binding MarR family transcriptional regulator